VEAGRRAAEKEHRTVGGVRVGDAGQRIGDAGTGGDCADADPAGEPRRRVGGVGRGLLVPRVDQLDAFLDARRVDRRNVQPRKREDVPHAFGLQHAHEELRTGRGCHQFPCASSLPTAIPPGVRPDALWMNALNAVAPSNTGPCPPCVWSASTKCATSSPAAKPRSAAGPEPVPARAAPRTSVSRSGPLPRTALPAAASRAEANEPGPSVILV